ncbi:DoxX family protein [Xanthobacter sp. DSM 24535]|uniref:DoxX family protein n=1 Tax=Roseixanthobacter psychrophilus TaxID=3119917 RepID=UPI0037285EAF
MNRIDDLALLVGRFLLAALFLPSGIRKAMSLGGTGQYLASLGVPNPEVMAIAVAATEIGLPILLVLGVVPRLTAVLTGGFVMVTALLAHRFWDVADAGAAMGQQIHFLKNAALVGGTMFYFVSGAGTFSLAGRKR